MRPHVFLAGGLVVGGAFVASLFAPDVSTAVADALMDRVGFPQDYLSEFKVLRSSFKGQKNLVGTTYANAAAASLTEVAGLPYPDGAVFVFEWTEPIKSAAGEPVVEEGGSQPKGRVTRIDVMRRGPGFGTIYGDDRAGEWEFASYRPDGPPMADAAELRQCAQCHQQAATRDFVFRGRFPPLVQKSAPAQASP